MKKNKIMIGILALVVAMGSAFATKLNNAFPGDLYYWDDLGNCERSPCETFNNTGDPCQLAPLYYWDHSTTDPCHPRNEWTSPAWDTDGGN